MGKELFIIAKIERSGALQHFDEILAAADGIMVARGDLGVEVPIQEIALTQKRLIAKANLAGKPVITATQMLESMVTNRLPTRAEVTDVANAILDGTDCVMLSAESAIGQFPEESVAMLGKIAASTEAGRALLGLNDQPLLRRGQHPSSAAEALAFMVEHALELIPEATLFVPTRSGDTPRKISRYKPSGWIAAISSNPVVCQGLCFSYGVHPIELPEEPAHWRGFAKDWQYEQQLTGGIAILVAGPSVNNPDGNYRVEFMRTGDRPY